MKRVFVIFAICFTFYDVAISQTISGFIIDASSGDYLPNAHVSINKKALAANNHGFFSIPVDENEAKIIITYVGYETYDSIFTLNSDTLLMFRLETHNELNEVVVSDYLREQQQNAPPGKYMLNRKEMELAPTLMGEKDVLKTIQLLPGIKSQRDGMSGFSVRGGSPGQNLILLDGVPVYNVNHLFGIFSVFSPEALKSVEIYKGAFPSNYSGRISSITDIKMREGNLYQTNADLTVGLVSSKFFIETPIKKGKSSFMFAARRTYVDWLIKPITSIPQLGEIEKESFGYYFYDFNSKVFWDLKNNGRLFLSFYSGRDTYNNSYSKDNTNYNIYGPDGYSKKEQTNSDGNYNWGNITSSLRWHNKIGRKGFINAIIYNTRYGYTVKNTEQRSVYKKDTLTTNASYQNNSLINDWGLDFALDFYLNDRLTWMIGAKGILHEFIPGHIQVHYNNNKGYNIDVDNEGTKTYGYEINGYTELQYKVTDHWKINPGFHLTNYFYGDLNCTLFQPRIYSTLKLNNNLVVKASTGIMAQPIHNLINNSSYMPVDIWVPSIEGVKPSQSVHFDIGIHKELFSQYQLQVEVYWRKMDNILTYRQGESFFYISNDWSDRVYTGRGKSMGLEFLLKKFTGNTTGWLGYTLSSSTQQYDHLNNGDPFRFSYDRLHYLTIVANHKFNNRISLSANWVYGSGAPYTLSSTAYKGNTLYGPYSESGSSFGIFETEIYAPDEVVYYSGINEYQLPAYHHLDLGIDFTKEKKKGKRIWSFSIYNIYARNNAFTLYTAVDNNDHLILKNITFLRFLPSISYRYVFK